MPSFTPNLNLYLPGGGSSGTITPDEVVDIDRLNQNAQLLDGFAGSTETRLDTLEKERSLVLLKPLSLVNCTVSSDGTITPNASVTSFGMDSLFLLPYRRFRVVYNLQSATAGLDSIRLRKTGVAVQTATYFSTSIESSATVTGGTTATQFSAFDGTSWGLNPGAKQFRSGWFELSNLMNTARIKTFQAQAFGFNTGIDQALRSGYLTGSESFEFDGLEINTTQAFSAADSWVKVYAYV